MNKNVWKDFELAVKQHRWDEMHPNAKKGKPIFPRRFYAVMGYPFWPHDIIRRMYYKLRYPQQRLFRKGNDFLF